jgi:uncharacterized protein YbaP (TraB family)
MKKLLLLLISFSITLFAQSSVWKITKNGDSIYLGGTLHLLKRSDYPLPKEFDKAYRNSDKLYFETNLQAGMAQSFQQKLFSKMRLESGQKLSTVLDASTYKRLKTFASKYPVNFNFFEEFKPTMIILTLTIAEFKNLGIDAPGVDLYYEQKARHDKKNLGSLESPDDQLNFLVSMGKGNEDSFVNKSLDDFNKTKVLMPKMTKAWRSGNLNALDHLFIKDMKKDYPQIYKSLLVDRNYNWLPIIKNMFYNNEKEFVLVGAAHLIGKDGLIYQLKKDGYKIEQVR